MLGGEVEITVLRWTIRLLLVVQIFWKMFKLRIVRMRGGERSRKMRRAVGHDKRWRVKETVDVERMKMLGVAEIVLR